MFFSLLLIFSLLSSPLLIHSSSLHSIHRSRDDEANSTRFSLFVAANPDGSFPFSSLVTHAFPCPGVRLEGEWEGAEARLLLPCTHGEVVHSAALEDFRKRNPQTMIAPRCSVVRGLELDFSALEIRLDAKLRLEGAHSLSVFSSSLPRLAHYRERPLVEFSYQRSDDECRTQCGNRSIYSTPSCLGRVISEDEIEMCDLSSSSCGWGSNRPEAVAIHRLPYIDNVRYLHLDATRDTVTYTSPFITHTSIKCSFTVEAYLLGSSTLSLSYSTMDGNHSSILTLPPSSIPFKFKPISLSIGHFLSPIRVELSCARGGQCFLNKLHMKDCEDDSSTYELCPSSSAFLCTSSAHSKCLSIDRVCDLTRDCHDGEDEDDCEAIPSHGHCDFSSASLDSFCSNWTTRGDLGGVSFGAASGRTGDSMLFRLLADGTAKGVERTFSSPLLPATSKKLSDPKSPLFGSCTLRFSYCSSARWRWVDFVWSISGQSRQPLWTPPEEASNLSRHCEWRREVITMPLQREAHSVEFSIRVRDKDDAASSFQLAQISLAESCFINDTSDARPISVVNLLPCNATGPSPPSIEQCQVFYNETEETRELAMEKTGWMTWIVPESSQYRVEACGASGRSLSDRIGGKGGCVVALLHLSYEERLEVMIGQEGDACSHCSSTSGGGATVVKKKDSREAALSRTILVAGGGGGVSLNGADGENLDGGRLSGNMTDEQLEWSFDSWKRGDAFSHAFFPHFNLKCKSCESMDTTSNRGGSCPSPLNGSMRGLGGYGGGGPACGESGGPGGGFIGGTRGGEKTGGSSFVLPSIARFEYFEGSHEGEGFIRISACSLTCPVNRSCRFVSLEREKEEKMECACIEGTDCQERDNYANANFFFLMAAFFCVLAFALLLYGMNQRVRRSLDRVDFTRQIHEIEMINLDMIDIENFDCLDNLNRIKIPHIPRTSIFLQRLLGRGAFGEVHLAEIREEDEAPYEVAIKTLGLALGMDTQIDFTFETLTLHKLNHPHIVRAMGINTEADPYYLVLEYMKGGDLRSFLRLYRSGSLKGLFMNMGDFLKMALDVVSGCEYLETNHHVHRDLAARNCLLTTRAEGRVVKLADFGMARDVYSMDYYRKFGNSKMPVKWLPPESYMEGVFTSKSDVWSYGVLMWELFSLGHMPYAGLSNFEVMEMVRLGKRLLPPNGTPNAIQDVMTRTWRLNEKARPTFKHLLTLIQEMAADDMMTIKPAPPGIAPVGLMQTDGDGEIIELLYPSIAVPSTVIREDTRDDHQSLLD